MALAAAKVGFDALGIDISEGMIAEAEAARAAQPAEAQARSAFRRGDLFANGLARGSADVLTALGVLEYLPEDTAFLAEAARLVRPGGLMVLEVRNRLFNMTTANRFTVAEIEAGAGPGLIEQLAAFVRAPLSPPARREFARRLKAVAERIDDALARDDAQAEPSAMPPSFGDSRRQHALGELAARAGAAGFAPVSTHALHPHALPPALEAAAPHFYNQLAWLFDALAAEPAALAWSSAMLVALRRRG
jgi:SAM-dependent methyltransferase